MRTCILHIGTPKTGTTSIQSSLFYGLRDERFRFLTQDSAFGNRLVGSAFAEDFGCGRRYISDGVSPKKSLSIPRASLAYLDRCLRASARSGATPILSAETIYSFGESELNRLHLFLAERGYRARVIGYVRAPWDFVESHFQQVIRMPQLGRWQDYADRLSAMDYVAPLAAIDRIFGSGNTTLYWFDPASFPGRCVVRHFCEAAGIPFQKENVIRENESLNANAVRFLFAMTSGGHATRRSLSGRLRWRLLIDRLHGLPGPPLRLHSSAIDPFLRSVACEWNWVERKIGHPLPMTMHKRDAGEGFRRQEDLFDFSAESLEWLGRETGHRTVPQGKGMETVEGVRDQLRSINYLNSPQSTRRIAIDIFRERCRRLQMRHANLC